MNPVRTILLTFLVGLTCNLHAQTALTAAGGHASGQDGTVSFSVGQVAYEYLPGTNGSVSQGVQQSYSDMMVSTDYERFLGSLTVYPNPVAKDLVIHVSEDLFALAGDQLSYVIFDLPGRQVARGGLSAHRTRIHVGQLQQGVYLVSIYFKTSRVTSSKIIKAE